MARDNFGKPEVKEFEEKVIQISRVSKKTKGGNKVGFSVLMVVGDKKGRVGVGLGKAGDVLAAIKKSVKKAKKKLISIPLDGTTIPFAITVKKGAGKVMLKPSSKGTGVIAGGPVRAVVEAAGVRDITCKIMGSDNQASSVYATFEALKQISKIVAIKGIKLRSISDIEEEERKKVEELQKHAVEVAEKHEETIKTEVAKQKPVAKKLAVKKPTAKKAASK
ncbi:MAG: 30S ribosomal protein S5 [Candidatus Pacebacteria bacterium GW2011_GWF2_38_9]|nr:MAG: 30S ribosomal protein S5, small subunit ribosomal protein S5 [candidate division TM6 bacterium GW2011_GWF2_28_16]KKQ08256.1 MAG: 30S ribosomal protein S5 [Candidatus Pacebacteria bacterium GW2011_GWF1_36_5]KKQ88574.1 MAG: 30S ribosomal protein S5 [Candidatus Pacebacteria bacterium GW2011_GWF2_38_9]HAZ73519.1 30S ribosomal protein S5 [Candidatus Paceibacterota bacterium]